MAKYMLLVISVSSVGLARVSKMAPRVRSVPAMPVAGASAADGQVVEGGGGADLVGSCQCVIC